MHRATQAEYPIVVDISNSRNRHRSLEMSQDELSLCESCLFSMRSMDQ